VFAAAQDERAGEIPVAGILIRDLAMTVRNLKFLFQPTSVTVVGASNRAQSVGHTVMRNLLTGGFDGPILPLNPKWDTVTGVLAYPDVASLPRVPDLAVICTPPASVPQLISELGARGTRAAIVLTAGFDALAKETGVDYRQATLDAARPNMFRILGPNCVGLLAPQVKLNASFAQDKAQPGRLAFVSQSGALATAVLDWANARDIGFSHFISLGNCWDVDFGDVLDYLGGDPKTHAILLYIESVSAARKFMSAARAAARNKPVIVIKAGRSSEGAAAAASHTGALAGADDVYDAAIRRAGMLRVHSIEDLFNAAELLGRGIEVDGDRLAIVTNGGGAGVMAADALGARGGKLAELDPETVARLDPALPKNWSRRNPIDIIGDAPAERYLATFEALAPSRQVDAVLLLQAPTAIVQTGEIAKALLPGLDGYRHPVLSCWLGGNSATEARRLFAANGIPTFDTPEDAVGAFMQLVDYRRNQRLLAETPPSEPEDFRPNRLAARTVIDGALADGRAMLSEPEAKAVLSCYDIPIVETRIVADAASARPAARELGFPVALKILSDDISHKSDVGGVVLDLADEDELAAAIEAMRGRVAELAPEARIKGFTVQPMARRPHAQELIVGAKSDAVFGPVILFGQGGTAVEITSDRAVGLPPMNLGLARRLVEGTRVARLLAGYRDRKAADLAEIYRSVVKIAQLITDIPEIQELDINPLLADSAGVLALDARVLVAKSAAVGVDRLAIRPYPKGLEESIELGGETMMIRPVRPEDEPQHRAFLESLDPQDVYFRFFGMVRHFEHSQLARFTQIDYDREMALVVVRNAASEGQQTVGVARIVCDPDNIEAEFAVIVHSDLKGKGLGTIVMQKLIAYCRKRGTRRIVGQVLADNKRMLALSQRLGFVRRPSEDKEVVEIQLDLDNDRSEGGRAEGA
jgi:acetyltransferase